MWCGKCLLKLVYSKLLSIACTKDAWVGEYMETPNNLPYWNVRFIQFVHDWKLDVVSHFFELLYSQKIRSGGGDKICWVQCHSTETT